MTRVVAIIPARYASSRFPGKPLVSILGKPMILHVAEKAAAVFSAEDVYIATDDERIAETTTAAGFQVVMTSDALTGTDRTWLAAKQIPADFYINIQGDEPMLDPADIFAVTIAKLRNPGSITNGMTWLTDAEDPASPNIPKVVTADDGRLIYMSRLPIPGVKDARNAPARYLKQVCIYGFTLGELKAFGSRQQKSWLEAREDIEILRFLDLGLPVQMIHTSGASLAVDIPEDVQRVEAELLNRQRSGTRQHPATLALPALPEPETSIVH